MRIVSSYPVLVAVLAGLLYGAFAQFAPVDTEQPFESVAAMISKESFDHSHYPVLATESLPIAENAASNGNVVSEMDKINADGMNDYLNGDQNRFNATLPRPVIIDAVAENVDPIELIVLSDSAESKSSMMADSQVGPVANEEGLLSHLPADSMEARALADSSADVQYIAPPAYTDGAYLPSNDASYRMRIVVTVVNFILLPVILSLMVHRIRRRVNRQLMCACVYSVQSESAQVLPSGTPDRNANSVKPQDSQDPDQVNPERWQLSELPPIKLSPLLLSLELTLYATFIVTGIIYLLLTVGAFNAKHDLLGRTLLTTGIFGAFFTTGLFTFFYLCATRLDAVEQERLQYFSNMVPSKQLFLGLRLIRCPWILLCCMLPLGFAVFAARPFVRATFGHPSLSDTPIPSSVWLLPLPWHILKITETGAPSALPKLLTVLLMVMAVIVVLAITTSIVAVRRMFSSSDKFYNTSLAAMRDAVSDQLIFFLSATVLQSLALAVWNLFIRSSDATAHSVTVLDHMLNLSFVGLPILIPVLLLIRRCCRHHGKPNHPRKDPEALPTGEQDASLRGNQEGSPLLKRPSMQSESLNKPLSPGKVRLPAQMPRRLSSENSSTTFKTVVVTRTVDGGRSPLTSRQSSPKDAAWGGLEEEEQKRVEEDRRRTTVESLELARTQIASRSNWFTEQNNTLLERMVNELRSGPEALSCFVKKAEAERKKALDEVNDIFEKTERNRSIEEVRGVREARLALSKEWEDARNAAAHLLHGLDFGKKEVSMLENLLRADDESLRVAEIEASLAAGLKAEYEEDGLLQRVQVLPNKEDVKRYIDGLKDQLESHIKKVDEAINLMEALRDQYKSYDKVVLYIGKRLTRASDLKPELVATKKAFVPTAERVRRFDLVCRSHNVLQTLVKKLKAEENMEGKEDEVREDIKQANVAVKKLNAHFTKLKDLVKAPGVTISDTLEKGIERIEGQQQLEEAELQRISRKYPDAQPQHSDDH